MSTVWIVDDSALDADVSRRALVDHNVRTFSDGSSMLEYLTRHEAPDAVMLEWTLPDLRGVEICRFLRAAPATAQVGVLMLTGVRVSIEDLVECMAAGANDYLIKPVRPAELGARVAALVRSSLWRRRAERAETALRTLLEQQPDAVLALDGDSRITFANASALRVADQPVLIGRRLQNVFPQLDLGALTELRLGGRVYSPAVKTLVVDAGPPSTTVSLRDVTEVTEAVRARDEFLAMLSHELRNPLAPILSAAEMLLRSPDDATRVTRASAVIERQVGRMARLIDDLLDVSRVTRGRIELRRQAVDLRTVIAHAVENAEPVMTANKHGLSVESGLAPLMIDGDPMRLEQVFSNLLDNAAKYTAPGGKIAISVSSDGKHAVIRVRDNGSGIPPASLARIFDLFHQADRPLARSTGGLGIGLSLVRALVEMHGGSVEVKSDGEYQGSEFTVRLPMAEVVVDAGRTAATPQAARHKILVVDDNEDAAELLVELLRNAGNDVEMALDGPKALATALAMQPDVVFLDIGLPGIDGYEVARRLRKSLDGRRCFLVALTGYGQAGDQKKAADAGFDVHLIKPISAAKVVALLGQVK